MAEWHPTLNKLMIAFSDGKPKTHRDVVKSTGLSDFAAHTALYNYWKKGLLLRTREPISEELKTFKGRAGVGRTTRTYYFYVKASGADSLRIGAERFVGYSKKNLDARGARAESKSKMIMNFLKTHPDRAFYSTDVAKALEDRGVKIGDVMGAVRRYERKGMVYVRGYRSDDRQTPFKEGYLLTWIYPSKSREDAIEGAIKRTDAVLAGKSSTSPIVQRVHQIMDAVIEGSKLKDLVSFTYFQSKLNCSEHEAGQAVQRAMQLYTDLREIKLFNAYNYYYHVSMADADLKAAVAMKENYIRKTKGRANRIGHNWEAAVEWFVDRFTVGAEFRRQEHRHQRMDPRRITLHLIKGVGGRRQNAEVDRVWSVTPGLLLQPSTYVLECKWGMVTKNEIDDFLEVLRWSIDFGVDTTDGRRIKQGVIGVFAGGVFDPKEKVRIKGEVIDLPTYAGRMNIQLLKAADLNKRLRDRGCKISVEKVCKIAADEKDVREALDSIWENPRNVEEALSRLAEKNKELYDFERMLEES
jgi:hypothetical protein